MKKKILALISALSCAFACAVGLAACGGGGGGGGTSNDIYLVRSDGTVVEDSSIGEFTYMESEEFAAVFNFKVCTKNADGEFVDLTAEDVTVTYQYNGEAIDEPKGLSDYKAGAYQVMLKYKDTNKIVFFNVNQSDKAHYTATVSKYEWKFGEEGATLSVYDGSTKLTEGDDYGARYITEAEYNEIKDAADKTEQQLDYKSYNVNSLRSMTPGVYYIFAECLSTVNYNKAYTDFKKVTVRKGDLTIKNAESLSTEAFLYNYAEKVGDIKLSDIRIYTQIGNDYENMAYAVDGFGEKVSGEFVWRNPDTEVNARKSGNAYSVMFVPLEQYRDNYNYTLADAGQVEITIYKGHVRKPRYTLSDDGTLPYGGSRVYDGKTHYVYTGAYNYDKYVDVTIDEQKMNVTSDDQGYSVIGSVTDVGTYTYTLSLKNDVNFYWYDPDSEDYDPESEDESDTDDLTFVYKVLPRESYVYTFGKEPILVPDNNGVIKLAIAPFATPYKAGTLHAVYDATDPDSDPIYSADVEIVTEDGVDYLKISNIQKIRQNGLTGFPIRFTAEGDDNYADIDILTYDFKVTFDISCQFDREKLVIYKTTTAGALYNNFSKLRTTVGDYKLQMKWGSGWMDIDEDQILPSVNVEYEFRLVFDVDSSKLDERVTVKQSEFEFTIKSVEVDSPITAGETIEATAGENVYYWLEANGYDLDNEYGVWEVECLVDGEWINYGGGFDIPEGETQCRLLFPEYYLYGAPEPVEFTLVGA